MGSIEGWEILLGATKKDDCGGLRWLIRSINKDAKLALSELQQGKRVDVIQFLEDLIDNTNNVG
jgi:hypothetical protein